MTVTSPAIRIGTSGWHYDSWIGPFYPRDTPKARLLPCYAERFTTTEINASFYRVPSERAVEAWRAQTPPGFMFAWKASRFVTHFKRLKDVAENIDYVVGRMAPLEDKFGPILWQLPPNMKPNHDRLARFLGDLPGDRLHAVEFRDPAWYETKTFQLLRNSDVALCFSDHAAAPAPWEVTASHIYIRPHGPGGRYEGNYPEATLRRWASPIIEWQWRGHDVFCYFDNDVKSAAPFDAERLIGIVAKRGGKLW